jgi:hypothetical protein
MTRESNMTDEQKGQVCGILSVGCDRETAANFIGCSTADLERAMHEDPPFAANVCRTEAGVELGHMRNIQQSAKDGENWRASVWWLERHAPDRFGPRSAGQVTVSQLKAFLDTVVAILNEEFRDDDQQRRLVARLDQIIGTLEFAVRSRVISGALSGDMALEEEVTESVDDIANAIGTYDQ